MPQRGLDASAGLAFEGVVVKLQVKKAQRVVVDGACGRVGGGGLLAVLGASGAGKTTLLAALAGEVACEGLVDRPSGVVAYCPQDDLLLPFLTVGERCARPATCGSTARPAVARRRGPGGARRRAAGDAGPRGRRGRARREPRAARRVRRRAEAARAGVELVLMPALLVADEPTSGLDSRSALEVADLLRRAPATAVASVHQPGARVFATFTDCLVLAPGGSPAYSGAAAAAPGAVAAAVGAAVPPLTSAAEYLLGATADPAAARGAFVGAARRPASWHRGRCRAGGGSRFGPLLERAWLNNRRSPVAASAAPALVTMALLVGALYAGSREATARTPYVLVGLGRTPGAVAAHVAFVGATLAAESLVLLVGAVAADAKTAVVICPVLLSTSLLFGGLFVSLDSLPAGLAVFQQLSLFRWSFAALLKAEFAAPDVLRGLPCPTPDGATHVARVLGAAGAARSLADDGAALAALVVGFSVLAYAALARRTRGADAAPAKQKAA
ncbi:ABC transporter [Aureococcus anophagefferens]|nr:ABC transporter [Aureococcus anophagefferens]